MVQGTYPVATSLFWNMVSCVGAMPGQRGPENGQPPYMGACSPTLSQHLHCVLIVLSLSYCSWYTCVSGDVVKELPARAFEMDRRVLPPKHCAWQLPEQPQYDLAHIALIVLRSALCVMRPKVNHQDIICSQPAQFAYPGLPAVHVKPVHAPHVYAGVVGEADVTPILGVLKRMEVFGIKEHIAL